MIEMAYKRIYHVSIINTIGNDSVMMASDIFNNIMEAKTYGVNLIGQQSQNGGGYSMFIRTISSEQKIFDTVKELVDYFNANINRIANAELFDFLLSLARFRGDWYDAAGRHKFGQVHPRCPLNETVFSCNMDFNETDCLKGIYTFEWN